jgi:hypothetical protein
MHWVARCAFRAPRRATGPVTTLRAFSLSARGLLEPRNEAAQKDDGVGEWLGVL